MKRTTKITAALALISAATSASAWWSWADPAHDPMAAGPGFDTMAPQSIAAYGGGHPYAGYPVGYPYGFAPYAAPPFAYVPNLAMSEGRHKDLAEQQAKSQEQLLAAQRAFAEQQAAAYEKAIAMQHEMAERQARAYQEAIDAHHERAVEGGAPWGQAVPFPAQELGSLQDIERQYVDDLNRRLEELNARYAERFQEMEDQRKAWIEKLKNRYPGA